MVYYGYNGQEIEDAEMDNMKRDARESIDNQGGLHVPIVPVSLPCEECHKVPALRYTVVGISSGVLCRKCLTAVVTQINQALAATQEETQEPVYSEAFMPCGNCESETKWACLDYGNRIACNCMGCDDVKTFTSWDEIHRQSLDT